jgi:DNA-binding CsgD family transcriptional regulator
MSARASFPGVFDGFVVGTAVVTAWVLLAALAADRRVSRRDRRATLEVERDQQAEIGAVRERARIAREVHHVVAHSLAVMVAQADAGRYAAPEDPARRAGPWRRSRRPVATDVRMPLLDHVASSLPDAPVDESRLATLSERERAILLEVARGLSNAEFAATLHLAEPRVKTYLGRLRSRLDLHDRVQLVIFAYDSGLVAPRR